MTSRERLLQAADTLEQAMPLIAYDSTIDAAPPAVDVVRADEPRHDWCTNISLAWRALTGTGPAWLRSLHRSYTWPRRIRAAGRHLVRVGNVNRPESSLDGGNVLIFWSEVDIFLSLWSTGTAQALAGWLRATAAGDVSDDHPALAVADALLAAANSTHVPDDSAADGDREAPA